MNDDSTAFHAEEIDIEDSVETGNANEDINIDDSAETDNVSEDINIDDSSETDNVSEDIEGDLILNEKFTDAVLIAVEIGKTCHKERHLRILESNAREESQRNDESERRRV